MHVSQSNKISEEANLSQYRKAMHATSQSKTLSEKKKNIFIAKQCTSAGREGLQRKLF